MELQDFVQINLKRDVFERLQALAVPLVDDVDSVVERLLQHWEQAAADSTVAKSRDQATFWRSARGERFPIGLALRGKYLGQVYQANVTPAGIEFQGTTYDNPSSAAIAVKKLAGTVGTAANTNGWDFWEMQDKQTKQWVSINRLRSKD